MLFRGKRKDNGEWVFGNLIYRRVWKSDVYVIRVFDSGFDNYEEYEVIPETIGQYTGLTDKNGTKIFEGDIVKYNKEYGCVEYHNEEAMFVISFDVWFTDFDSIYGKDFEVIGNIHDNKLEDFE